MIGTVCEELSCCIYNMIPVYFEGMLQARAADSPDDSEMLDIIRDTRTIGFAYIYQLDLSNIFNQYGKSSELALGLKVHCMAEKKFEKILAGIGNIP